MASIIPYLDDTITSIIRAFKYLFILFQKAQQFVIYFTETLMLCSPPAMKNWSCLDRLETCETMSFLRQWFVIHSHQTGWLCWAASPFHFGPAGRSVSFIPFKSILRCPVHSMLSIPFVDPSIPFHSIFVHSSQSIPFHSIPSFHSVHSICPFHFSPAISPVAAARLPLTQSGVCSVDGWLVRSSGMSGNPCVCSSFGMYYCVTVTMGGVGKGILAWLKAGDGRGWSIVDVEHTGLALHPSYQNSTISKRVEQVWSCVSPPCTASDRMAYLLLKPMLV